MTDLAARCRKCGMISTLPGLISVDSTSSIVVQPGATTICPLPGCGGEADVLPGIYKGDAKQRPRLASGPPETVAIVSALRRAVEEAKAGADEDRLIEVLTASSPALGALARTAKGRLTMGTLAAFLIWLLASCEAEITVGGKVKLDLRPQALIERFEQSLQPHGQAQPPSSAQPSETASAPEKRQEQKPSPTSPRPRLTKRQKRRAGQWTPPKRR